MYTFASIALLGVAKAMSLSISDSQLMNYITKFGKSYNTILELNIRAERFAKTNDEIQKINAS